MANSMEHEGELVFVRGYGAVFDSLSVPLDEYGGKCEMILPPAFSHVLRNLRASTTCVLFHMSAGGTIGSIFDGTLQIWADSYGLAFECGPLVPNAKNAWAVRSIISGGARGCSWRGIAAEKATETIDGEQVVVIRKMQHLSHISPLSVAAALYPDAATWCSHEHLDDLSDYLKRLSRRWEEQRPAAKPSLAPRAEAPEPQAPSRAEQAAKAHHEALARRPRRARTRRLA